MTFNSRRRSLLRSLSGLTAASVAPGLALSQAPRRYAVISLLGDELVVVYAAATTGSNVDRNRHRAVPDTSGGFDKMVLSACGRLIETRGGAASLISVGPSPLHQTPEKLFDGGDIALPDAWVGQIEQSRATHVLLLTKHRGPTRIAMTDGLVGVGSLRGLGYYVDRMTHIAMARGGATGVGMIAAYAYAQLTLADASTGKVLRQDVLQAARPYAVAQSETAMDPWELLSPADKVSRLRDLLENRLARELPPLLAA